MYKSRGPLEYRVWKILISTTSILEEKEDIIMHENEKYTLPQEQVDHFLEHGWLKLSACFTREQAEELKETLWTRLGMDPNDMSTW